MNEATTWSPALQWLTPGSDRFDDAGALVAAAERHRARVVAGQEVHVAVAEPAGDVADEHLVVLGFVDVDLDDLVAAGALAQHSGA